MAETLGENQRAARQSLTTPEILDVRQVAEILRCDADTAAKRLNNGDLPGLKFSHSWIIPASVFYERLAEMAKEEAAKRRQITLEEAEARRRLSTATTLPPPVAADVAPKRRGRQRFRPPGF
ncbi:helix-turn-helix domain-containing protein [Rhodocyclus tenuis]|uniref:helix-turn-helix domain-containing protein n=1 Tax=Rhodocyclus tenuis TaxID=1066 RepID=UPI001C856572|nr:helix-turn-helix domain-containing protein [Rhodocyclus tenuis]